jgi:hypothetical protein
MTAPGAAGGVPLWQDPALVELRGRLRELAGSAIDRARAVNLPDLPLRLSTELAHLDEPSPAMVLFAGEPSTGKTSLINALVGRADLLPVDVDVATNSYVVVIAGDPAAARVFRAGDERGQDVELTALGDWGSEGGNPDNHKRVGYVQAEGPAPLLRHGVGLIDTPGVGGLAAVHGDITLAALSRADALVFTLSAGAPLSRPELDFLSRAAARIDTVVLLLTKTDAYPGWRRVMEEDRELLRDRAPRFADGPILPVSAKLARLAVATETGDDPHLAAELRMDSGLNDLEQLLIDRVAARRTRLRMANATRLTATTLEQVSAAYAARAATLAGDPAPLRDLELLQARLTEQTGDAQTWRGRLGEAFTRLNRVLCNELQVEITELRGRFEIDIATNWRRGRQKTLAAEVEADLARLRLRIQQTVVQRAVEVIDEHTTRLQMDGLQVRAGELTLPDRDRLTPRTVNRVDASTRLGVGRSLTSVGGLRSVGVHSAAGLLGALTTPLMLLGAAMAVLTALAQISKGIQVNEQKEASRLLNEGINQFQRDATLAISDLLDELRGQAALTIEQELVQRLATTKAQFTELTAAAAKASRSQTEQARLKAGRAAIDRLVNDCRDLITELAPRSAFVVPVV